MLDLECKQCSETGDFNIALKMSNVLYMVDWLLVMTGRPKLVSTVSLISNTLSPVQRMKILFALLKPSGLIYWPTVFVLI